MEPLRSRVVIKLFSWKEIVFFVAFFLALAALFFPAGKLEEYLEQDAATNAELTRKYTEALLRVKSPSQIKLAVLRRYAYEGDEEKVLKLLKQVRKENPLEADELEYELLKRKYFSSKDETVRRRMRVLLYRLIKGAKDERELKRLYREALSMNFPELAFEAAYRLALKTGSPYWKEEAFLLALQLSKKEVVERLAGSFEPRKPETARALYYYYLAKGDWRRALYYLNKAGPAKEEEKIVLEFLAGRDEEALNELLALFQKNPDKAQKVLLETFRTLSYAGRQDEMRELIKSVLPLVKADERFYAEILKLALATGDAHFAAEVARLVARETGVLKE
ncbi:MAG: hypothetical protein GXO03_05185 [Aquificae bacterium]|nr:hypothetical protein [Aquificota bacterium]